jgi:hypothetical protein
MLIDDEVAQSKHVVDEQIDVIAAAAVAGRCPRVAVIEPPGPQRWIR